MGRTALLVAITAVFLSCATTGVQPDPAPALISVYGAIGFSGMAKYGPGSYLVVHDTKAHKDGPRLGLLEVTAESGTRYSPLAVMDWVDPEGRSSDLESACALPGRPGEFLVAESGYWEGKYGRIFRVQVDDGEAEILQVFKLPMIVGSGVEQEGDNFEGLACVALEDGQVRVILGERGGTELYPDGLLRWGTLDLGSGLLTWEDEGDASIPVKAPGSWPAGTEPRAISDLHITPDGILWAIATADAGDNGPFRSAIHAVGRTGPGVFPVEPVEHPEAAWIIDGLKVESLAAPADLVPGSVLSIGTEDEHFSGVWRALYPIVQPTAGE